MFKNQPYWIIAYNAFFEARHSKVLYIAAGFAAGLIVFSLFMGEVSLYQNEKIVKDIGLASISLLGIFVAIFLGVNSLYKDLEHRTIYSIVSKPIDRYQILLGKYLGMAAVLALIVIMMTLYLYLVTSFLESKVDFTLLPAIFLIFCELLVVAAIATFFSSFSSPFLSGFFTVGLVIVGRISYELGQFGQRSKNELFKLFATSIQKAFDLEAFNLRDVVVHKLPVQVTDVIYPSAYGFFLVLTLLILSTYTFHRRDFK